MLAIFFIFFLVVIDQITKYLALNYLQPISTIPLINNIFSLTYVENRGAAFGIFQGSIPIFVVITIVVVIFLIMYYKKLDSTKPNNYIKFTILLLLSGAFGNFIDRLSRGYVVDMFHFTLIDFPVFNMADIYVVIGSFLLIIITLIFSEDEKKNKKELINE
ncbi:MAG: signal peptidase II [Lachnospirales bacterium]